MEMETTETGMATTATMEMKTAAEVEIAGMEIIHPRTPTPVVTAMEATMMKVTETRTKSRAETTVKAHRIIQTLAVMVMAMAMAATETVETTKLPMRIQQMMRIQATRAPLVAVAAIPDNSKAIGDSDGNGKRQRKTSKTKTAAVLPAYLAV